jgi:hypothetical protein
MKKEGGIRLKILKKTGGFRLGLVTSRAAQFVASRVSRVIYECTRAGQITAMS